MSGPDETDAIRARYARRTAIPAGRYSRLNPEVLARVHERQRALVALFARQGVAVLDALDVLEVGCGSGANLQELIAFGASPERLVGNELLDERLAEARRLLPAAVRLLAGDASTLTLPDASFHLVVQSTVFSSIVDDALQRRLADAMWRWTKPGGAVLWYDFVYNNPANPDVRGVPVRRIRELFPQARLSFERVTLAPPIARRVVRLHPAFYTVFNAVPLLRTHVLAWIGKPG